MDTDAMGNLICRRGPRRGKKSAKGAKKGDPIKVMLLCHMDEIGFYVSSDRREGLSVDQRRGRV
jgi:putative aminopeptidase FrvX